MEGYRHGLQNTPLCELDGSFKQYLVRVLLFLCSGDNVALMVNNLGGTSYLELNIIARAAVDYLGELDLWLSPTIVYTPVAMV